jgi:hypothetical protein
VDCLLEGEAVLERVLGAWKMAAEKNV